MDNLYVQTIRASISGMLVFLGILFIPAWTFAYWQGWAFFATFGASATLLTLYMAVYDKKLLERRLHAGPGAEKTPAQKVIMTFAMAAFVASVVIPVLDHRFSWSPAVPSYLSIIGDACVAFSFIMIFLVLRANSYAASTIQVDSEQKVISTGPYAVVRHPMYAGALPIFIMTPIALGSWWGLIFVPLFIPVLILRLLDEEKFLRKNLPGYAEYATKTRWRLIPGIF
ncbi:MAG TPA: isoprenylcysteine carboxylmethyltransferase family protein [Candidatus Paceibacterota bacterium]|nr:isoprenylcysteine carboxylmethyltransferase family protein [Candidatus Paceibacterota bacterium]